MVERAGVDNAGVFHRHIFPLPDSLVIHSCEWHAFDLFLFSILCTVISGVLACFHVPSSSACRDISHQKESCPKIHTIGSRLASPIRRCNHSLIFQASSMFFDLFGIRFQRGLWARGRTECFASPIRRCSIETMCHQQRGPSPDVHGVSRRRCRHWEAWDTISFSTHEEMFTRSRVVVSPRRVSYATVSGTDHDYTGLETLWFPFNFNPWTLCRSWNILSSMSSAMHRSSLIASAYYVDVLVISY